MVSIRWKLILSIGVPLVLIFGYTATVEYEALRTSAYRRMQDHVSEVAASHATRLDGRFSTVAQVAHSVASFLSTHPVINEAQLYEMLRRNVRQEPLIYGATVAFAPGSFHPERRLVAPYIYREDEELQRLDIGQEVFDYTNSDWYARPRDTGDATWTEPFFDKGHGNVLVCTHAVPFYRDGEFWGVVAVEIRLDNLQELIGEFELRGGNFVVVSKEGRFITHPDPDYIFHRTIEDVAAAEEDPKITAAAKDMLEGREGMLRVTDFPAPDSHWLFYRPIRSTGWSFAAAFPEAEVMRPVYQSLLENLMMFLAALVLIILLLLLISFWITRPIGRLADAVRRLGAGDLDVQVEGVRSRDEIGQLARGFNHMVRELKHHIARLTEETAGRQAVESELNVARQIQTSLLPQRWPERDDFELYGLNVPARQVAGDFFDFVQVDENRLAIIMADVSGKGAAAALFMAVARTVLRNLALDGLAPADMLRRANLTLLEDNEQMMFVTAYIAHYHTDTGRIVYANAGHPPPLRIDRDRHTEQVGETTGTVLGALPDQTWDEHEETLGPGQTLVLYTDGVIEATDDSGRMFSEDRLARLLAEHHDSQPLDQSCRFVVRSVEDFQHQRRSDDVTIMMLRRSA